MKTFSLLWGAINIQNKRNSKANQLKANIVRYKKPKIAHPGMLSI